MTEPEAQLLAELKEILDTSECSEYVARQVIMKVKKHFETSNEIRALRNGDIFDIGQTVNGQSEFVMMNIDILDVRYNYDRSRKYEYSVINLLAPDRYTGELTYKIIGVLTVEELDV